MVFINCLDISDVTMKEYEMFYSMASDERKQRAKRYKNIKASKQCILADILLRYSLFQTFGYQLEPVIGYGIHGKPYIKNVEGVFFNISHSGKWIVVAFGMSEVGVDIEKIRWNGSLEGVVNRFYTEEEKNYIFSATDEKEKAIRFTKVWSLKESYIKFLGEGLSKGLSSFSVDSFRETVHDISNKETDNIIGKSFLLEEYVLSICSRENDIKINEISIEKIGGYINGSNSMAEK